MVGIVVLDKPIGITSHDAVSAMRRRFQTKRIGHAGTLDPQATGVLVVAVGGATRFLQYLDLEPKVYECEITFGETRNTQDSEGEVTSTAPVPDDLADRLSEALPTLTGPIEQVPPMFSAVKKQGKPLYTYARRGEEVEREPRPVTIHKIEILEVSPPRVYAHVTCSGGTYVRTLAHDLGQLLGCGAYLSALARTAVGKFTIEEAAPPDDVRDEDVIPLREALSPMEELVMNLGQERMVLNGQAIRSTKVFQGPRVQLVNTDGTTIALAEVRHSGELQPLCVIPRATDAP